MKFADALGNLNQSKKMRRSSWSVGTWICLMSALTVPAGMVNARTRDFVGDGDLHSQPYFAMHKDGKWQPGWSPSVEDVLAEDWVEVEDPKQISLPLEAAKTDQMTEEERFRHHREAVMDALQSRISEMSIHGANLTQDQQRELDGLRIALDAMKNEFVPPPEH